MDAKSRPRVFYGNIAKLIFVLPINIFFNDFLVNIFFKNTCLLIYNSVKIYFVSKRFRNTKLYQPNFDNKMFQ